MSSNEREDYLINILRLSEGEGTVRTSDLADYMNIRPSSVTGMLKVLKREGLVNYQRYKGISLTEEGERRARDLRRKHHIVERFFTDVLSMDPAAAHEQAHAAEHHLSEESANRMCHMMGTKVDEDCSTCTEPCSDGIMMIRDLVAVRDMVQGDKGRIAYLSSNDTAIVKRLISMGFVPGRDVELSAIVSEKGARIIKMGAATIALDAELASAIFVNTER